MTTAKQHGGPRAGAGRKQAYEVKMIFRLTKAQQAKVKALGGAKWLRGSIDAANIGADPL